MAIDRQESPYRRGNRYGMLPIPMVQEHCIPVDAGAVQLVIESRRLTNAILEDTYHGEVAANVAFDDHGATLHVLGTDDGLEHLRFDCFEQEPHYHYDPDGKNNRIFLNTTRVSDPIAWTIDYLRGNFTSLVRIAGYDKLAAQLDEAALTATLPGIEKALRESAPRA